MEQPPFHAGLPYDAARPDDPARTARRRPRELLSSPGPPAARPERASDVIRATAIYPKCPRLVLLQDGVKLPDPTRRLRGAGARVRHIVLDDPSILDAPDVRKLVAVALERARMPLDPKRRRAVVIKSVAAKQRPRRTGAAPRRGG